MKRAMMAGVAALACAGARAEVVQVEILGTVDYNVYASGPFAGVPSGAPAALRFQVDSNNFLNSASFPTRGYVITQASFTFQAGAASTTLYSPFPAGQTPYFVLRNNDPAVDGFFISMGTDFPAPLPLQYNANAGMNFLVTYGGTTLNSLDILSAVGTYTFAGISVFDWRISVGPGDPMGMIFDTITISVLPAPCYANCDGSTAAPILNVNDFSCFLNLYAAGSVLANCDASTVAPVLNVNDFSCFLNKFAAGCP